MLLTLAAPDHIQIYFLEKANLGVFFFFFGKISTINFRARGPLKSTICSQTDGVFFFLFFNSKETYIYS